MKKDYVKKNEVKKTRTFRSLTVTLAITFLVLSLGILIIASSLEIYFNFQTQQKVVADQQYFIAQEAANAVKSYIQEKFSVLKATASISNLASSPQEQQKLAIEKLLGLDPAFRQIVLFNAQEQVLARISRLSNFEPNKLTEQFKNDILSQVSQGKMYVSPIYIDEITSEPMVIMAVPVKDVFGDFKGILTAEVNLKFMWDLVGRVKIGNSGMAYVVDRQGNLIAFSDISRVLKGENVIELKEVSEFVNNKELLPVYDAEVSKGIQGNDVVANYVPLGTPDWAVVVELPVNEAYQSLIEGFIRSVLIILLSLVLAIIAGIYLSKSITKPIILLRDATREISKGKLDTQIEIKSENEIGELTESFNKMTEDLQKTTVSKNYVDDILKSMFDMLVVLTPDNTIRTVNQTTCHVLGYREEELVGQPFNIILAQENSPAGSAWLDELVKKGTISNIENVFRTKDGRKISVIFSASVMRDKEGTIQGIVCVAHDITERKEAEKAIVEKEKEYRTILRTTMDGFWITDLNGRFLDVNDAYCRLIGYSRAELLAMGIQDIEEKERPEETRQRITRIRELGFDRFETRHRCKDGRIVDVEVSVNYLGVDEGRLFVFLRDITERKRAETALLRFNEELEKGIRERTASLHRTSEQLKDEILQHEIAEKRLQGSVDEKIVLLREIHHRVKNNLQIIISLTNLQMHQVDDPQLKQIMVETQNRVRAMSFVHEKLYRSEDISHINLADYTRFLATHLFAFYGVDSRKLALKIEIGKILLDINTAIPVGLIINELVSNAIKHAFPNGRKGEIWISVEQQNHTLTILFRDDGIGIPQDVDWRNVTSLGLRLVILLVNQLNGTIELDRTAGTAYHISIPEKEQ